jgi:hypothetical protein
MMMMMILAVKRDEGGGLTTTANHHMLYLYPICYTLYATYHMLTYTCCVLSDENV